MVEPFYSDSMAAILRGDCREWCGEPFADCAICDPPYGDTSMDWDRRDFAWLDVCALAVRPTGTIWCFGSMSMFLEQADGIADRGWRFVQDIVWEKHNGSGFHADRFKRVHEHAIQLVRRGVKWRDVYHEPVTTPDATPKTVRRKRRPTHMGEIERGHYKSEDGGPRLMRSVFRSASCHGAAVHPTQKPIAVLAPLVEYSCPPGGYVFDPTCGSGSSLVAAKLSGRSSVGIELREDYCRSAADRLVQTLPLGAAAAHDGRAEP